MAHVRNPDRAACSVLKYFCIQCTAGEFAIGVFGLTKDKKCIILNIYEEIL